MGMNISQMLGNDPDVLRYQLMQQEMQRYNQYQDPRMNLASTLGGLLGGGVVNVAQGRNFFQSNNPILKKASDLQNIYNQTAQSIDPNTNPAEFYKTLQTNLSAAGYGQQAAMAAQEAYKYSLQERELGLKERQVSAQEKNVSPYAQSNYITSKGIAAVFNKETGGYTVNGEPYNPTKHGTLEYAAKPDWRADLLKPGGGTPAGAPAPKGKEKKQELTDEEKRAKFNRVQGKTNPAAPAADDETDTGEAPVIEKRTATSGGRNLGQYYYVAELDKSFRTEAEAKAALEAYRAKNRPQSVMTQPVRVQLNPETTNQLFSLN